MTKICKKCKTENVDNSGFCQKCGTKFEETKNNTKTDKTTLTNIKSYWNKQTKNRQTGIGLALCCLGILFIWV